MSKKDKKRAVEAITIAERLYKRDRVKFKECFAWIGLMVRQEKDAALVLAAIKRLEEKAREGGPAGEVMEYLQGTMRRLEEEGAPAKAKAVETLGQIMDRAAMLREKKNA